MKDELFKIGKKVIFTAGKYMPKALIGVSAGATVGAIFLAIQAGMEYQELKDSGEEITWKDYGRIFGPCLAAGVFAIACAFAGLTKQEQRYAAAAALASVYESKGDEFEAKAREIFGDKEVEKAKEEIVNDKLKNAQAPMVAYGGTAFLDFVTGQYIYMDVETIRARINDLNEYINNGKTITKVDWCDTFYLTSTTADENIVWNNTLTGNIKPLGKDYFTFTKLPDGRTVGALQVTEPRLLYEEEEYYTDEEVDEYYRQRNPGWSEV
jgi:predicted acylesterase/phospholipase RssA